MLYERENFFINDEASSGGDRPLPYLKKALV